ncbi:AAA family ATPase [Brevibacillus agri]|uniref:AAA family ATPase n=1 Tax=Brevibacillus agri TaxID=51101 RepID=UPI003D260957
MPAQKDEAVRGKLDELIRRGIKVTDLAASLEFSHSTVSRYIRTDYMSEALQEKARAFLIENGYLQDEQAATTEAQEISEFYLTRIAAEVIGVCEQCFEHRDIGVIVGESGIGKTTALKKYVESNPQAVYIRANANMTQKALLKKIGTAIGLQFDYMDINAMVEVLIEKLADTHYIFLIDEAEYLINVNSPSPMRKLEMLRTLYDETETFGLVLCGMTRFKGFLMRGTSMKENLAQFWNRVFRGREFGGTSREDVEPIMGDLHMPEDGRQEIVARSLANGGNMRRFMKLLESCMTLTKKKGASITRDVVRQADTLLLRW